MPQTASNPLVEYLTAVSQRGDVGAALAVGAEAAAEEFDAEVAAIVVGDELAASVGFGSGEVPEDLLRGLDSGMHAVVLPGLGACDVGVAGWVTDAPGRLLVARADAPFTPEERNLLLGMARTLGLTLRMLGALEAERRRQRLLEVLLDIQRSISHRAPLQEVLEEITRGASALLGGASVRLRLDDALDPAHPIVASSGLPPEEGERLALPVHVNGEPAGALVATGGELGEEERATLAAFAEHASLALTDARTVDAMEEAFHDPLTGLPNRALFLDRLGEAIAADEEVVVLFIDLDRFKWVNDTLGHAAGDELLCAVAGRLAATLRPRDSVARFGGDEFAVLLEGGGAARGERVAERIVAALSQPFALEDGEAAVGASVGVATTTDGATDPQELLRQADLAMYRAKNGGRGRWARFEAAMRGALAEHPA